MIFKFVIIILLFASSYFIFKYFFYKDLVQNINIVTVFFCFFYAFCFVGSTLLFLIEFEQEKYYGFYNNYNYLFTIWLLSYVSLIFFSLGTILIKRSNKIVSQIDNSYLNWTVFYILLFMSFIYTIDYRNSLGGFPLEKLFNISENLSLLRSNATNNYSGKLFIVNIFVVVIPQLLFIIVSFVKKSKKQNILYIYLFLFNVFISISTLEKGPLIKFIILLLIIKIIKKEIRFNIKKIIVFTALFLIIIYSMYYFIMGQSEKSFYQLNEIILHRIFISQISSLYWYINFVDFNGFLMGLSFPNPGGFLPFKSISLPVKMVELYKPNVGLTGVVGSMPTVYYGDWYANFGIIGVSVSSFFFGYVLQFFDNYFNHRFNKTNNILTLSLYLYMILFFTKYSGTSNTGILFDYSFVVPFILIYTLKLKWKN